MLIRLPASSDRVGSLADTVNYFGTLNTYAVGSQSQSERTFGVEVNKGAGGGNIFYINGSKPALVEDL